MNNISYVDIVVKDAPSESVLKRIVNTYNDRLKVRTCYCKSGYGDIKKHLAGFNAASRYVPYLVLTDLDRYECPPELINDWFGEMQKHPNLVFRIAVHQVESWLMADRDAFSKYFKIAVANILRTPDDLDDSKRHLIDLVRRKCRNRDIKDDIVPRDRSLAKQGRAYNGRLVDFIRNDWNPAVAEKHSPSLGQAIIAVSRFKPSV